MSVSLALTLSIISVVVTFLLLPFLNYFILPFNKKNQLVETEGKIELNANLSKAFSDIKIEDDKITFKRNEGVQRISLIAFYKIGILTLRKYYYLEIATDEVSIPKLAKGSLFKLVVSEVDGVSSYKGIAYGISMPLFIATSLLQFVTMFTFTLLLAIGISGYLDNIYIYYFRKYVNVAVDERWQFFLVPLLVAIALPVVSFLLQLTALKGKKIMKEVK